MYTELPIKQIIISDDRRELQDIASLTESIQERGLINPITVTEKNRLVAGLHRLKACEALGWEKIPAIVLDLDELEAEMTEIDENLIRHELSALQRAELLLRRKELYEARYPYTKKGKYNRSTEPDHNGRDVRYASDANEQPSFSKNTAKEINLTERTIRRDVFIASKLDPEVKEMIRNTPLEQRTTDLLTLSKLQQEEQYIVAKMAIANPEAKLSEVIKTRAVESAEAQVYDFAPKPKIQKADPIAYLESLEPKSVNLLITEPPHDVKDLPAFIRKWVPLAMSRLTDKGQAYIISSSNPAEMQAYFHIFGLSQRFVLINVLNCYESKCTSDKPKQSYKRSWNPIFYLRGREADHFDCGIEREQFDIQRVEKKSELAERLIRHSSHPFDEVLDPFAGDGTILQAVTRLGRLPLGCEMDANCVSPADPGKTKTETGKL